MRIHGNVNCIGGFMGQIWSKIYIGLMREKPSFSPDLGENRNIVKGVRVELSGSKLALLRHANFSFLKSNKVPKCLMCWTSDMQVLYPMCHILTLKCPCYINEDTSN